MCIQLPWAYVYTQLKLLKLNRLFQYLWVSSILLSSRSTNITRNEEEDKVDNLIFYKSKLENILYNYIFRSGQYEFPKPEWTNVSTECKSLIKLCLKTNPDERPTIDQVIASPWISVIIFKK